MTLSLDFAFEGFRIVRQKPTVILFWGLVSVICSVLGMLLSLAVVGQAPPAVMQALQTGDPQQRLAAYAQVAPAYLLTLPFSVVMQALISAAAFRAALRPVDDRFGGLRLGMDELRQAGVGIIFLLLSSVISAVCLLIGSIIASLLAMVLGNAGVVIGLAAGAVATIWLIVRLSLAPVQSFDRRRIDMFGSWQLTKGHTGMLLAGYAVAMAMAALVYFLCTFIVGTIAILLSGGNAAVLEDVQRLASMGLAAFKSPVFVGLIITVNLFVVPLLMAIAFGAPAAAYRALTGRAAQPEKVF